MALLRNALLITIGILIGVCISRFRPVHWCLSPSGQLVPAPRADSEQDDDQAGLIESEHQLRGFGNANENRDSLQRPKYVSQETNFRRPLYVGVVTASSFLGTRVTAVNNTWGKNAPKIEYFTAEGQKRYRSLPIVSLPGVDDIYPPQKKVYRMLAYMHDNYINHFNWFLRADDDVYIRIPELLKFLSKLDPGELHYIGSPGFGRENDLKRIKLHQHERFCMGGPGVIFSRALLMKLKPHLEDCLKEVVVSWNEDVEVGRCVSRKLDIQCSWSYEMRKLFFTDYSKGKMFKNESVYNNKAFTSVISAHPFKSPDMMYRVHQMFLEMGIVNYERAIYKVNKELEEVRYITKRKTAF